MREQEIIGGYRLLKRLGAGGAATVWLACDEAGDRVALKILHPALAADDDYRERLLREARTVNSIRGGGVAHILDIEIDATQPFVVSEYIPGPTLSELLSRGAINVGGVAAIGGALAQTLDDVHARRIVHRDVKASNVICSPRGPVLIDFGIAMGQDEARLTQTGLVSGTAGYTAPELLRGAPASATTDWWAWTATLLATLTGRPPYGSGVTAGILDRVLKGNPDVRGLDPLVAQLMCQGLHPDPQVRPSADSIIRHLAKWGGFPLEKIAIYGGSQAWENLNWARLLAPVRPGNTSSASVTSDEKLDEAKTQSFAEPSDGATYSLDTQEATQAYHLGENTQDYVSGEPTAAYSPVSASLEQEDPDRTQVFDERFSSGDSTQVYPQVSSGVRGQDTALFEPLYPTASSTGTSYLPVEDGYRQAVIPPEIEFTTEERTYISRPMRPANILGLMILSALALIPVYMGLTGLIAIGVICGLFAVLGSAYQWREKRRILNQEARSSDTWAALGVAPFTGIAAILSAAAGLFPGAALAWGQWILFSRNFYQPLGLSPDSGFFSTPLGDPGASWFPLVLTGQTPIVSDAWLAGHPSWILLTWILTTLALWGMWVMPTGSSFRMGVGVAVSTCAPRGWMRLLLGALIAIGSAVVLGANF